MFKNKKADERIAVQSSAYKLSDKIKALFRYFKLSKELQGCIIASIDCLYNKSVK